jgi:t-SNARE complex subunit (syntaxin)
MPLRCDKGSLIKLKSGFIKIILRISGQLKGMTEHMSITVKEQGEAFGKLEDHVVEIKTNALGAENEINEAEKLTRRNTRKLLYIFLLVAFVVISIVVIMLMLFLPKSDDKKLI